MRSKFLFFAAPLLCVLAGPAANAAQDPLYSFEVEFVFEGQQAGDALGRTLAGAGDVNGDGFDDVLVGAPGENAGAEDSGAMRVYSGADGSLIHLFPGAAAGDRLGSAVAAAGDLNADGHADLIAGAWEADTNGDRSGMARVYSGLDGSVLYTFVGDAAGDQFGYSVAGLGDMDGDGVPEVAVGARRDDPLGRVDAGSVTVFSGADGSVLYWFIGSAAGDQFGRDIAGPGDVDGDGRADLLVGSNNLATGTGYARVLAGVDGKTLFTIASGVAGDSFGSSVGAAGDLDGDSRADFVIGAYTAAGGAGAAAAYSGADATVIHSFAGLAAGDQFGFVATGAGDVDFDGVPDLLVSAPLADGGAPGSGAVTVYSGADGTILTALGGLATGDQFGIAAAAAGNINGDCYDDVIVGARAADPNGEGSGTATVFVVAGNACNLPPLAHLAFRQLTALGSEALVEFDGTASSDPDADPLHFSWTIDGTLACAGDEAACGRFETGLAFGQHEVALTVTDPAGESDTIVQQLRIDPASLSHVTVDQARVHWHEKDELGLYRASIEGEIGLPAGTDYPELEPVLRLAVEIGGGSLLAPELVALVQTGRSGSEWLYEASGAPLAGVESLQIVWDGSRFRFDERGLPVRIVSRMLSSAESRLQVSVSLRDLDEPLLLGFDGCLGVQVDPDGTVTPDLECELEVLEQSRRNVVFTLTLPGALLPDSLIFLAGALERTVLAGDHLAPAAGRYSLELLFGTEQHPAGEATVPATLGLGFDLGAAGYPGAALRADERGEEGDRHWEYR